MINNIKSEKVYKSPFRKKDMKKERVIYLDSYIFNNRSYLKGENFSIITLH